MDEEDMDHYAIINQATGAIDNISRWDGVTPWQPPAGFIAVKCGKDVHTGSIYDPADGSFSNPAPESDA